MRMKRRGKMWGIFLIILTALVSTLTIARAEVDWTLLKEMDLSAQPLDIAVSTDGKLIFILTPGEILVYSEANGRITNRIPIEKGYDRLTYSGRKNALILTSSSFKTLKIVRVDRIYPIDITGLPFKGPANAPITIAVFDDYQ
jgi:hypothetical protein